MQPETPTAAKSLAEQRLDLERLQMSDPARYALQSTQERLDKVLAEQLERGEIDEHGRPMKDASGKIIPPYRRRDR
jgi:hypothetical protein